MSIERVNGCYIPRCDYCGKPLSDEPTFKDAVKAFYANGWKVRKYGAPYRYKNICPECLEYERSLKE